MHDRGVFSRSAGSGSARGPGHRDAAEEAHLAGADGRASTRMTDFIFTWSGATP